MNSNTSPLETMASYAITFLAGALSLGLVSLYGDWRQQKGETKTEPTTDQKQ